MTSCLLNGEPILVVYEKQHLKEAEHAHPDLVVYFPPEIEELRRHRGTPGFPQLVRTIHAVKKHIGGWVVPSAGQTGADEAILGKLERRERAWSE